MPTVEQILLGLKEIANSLRPLAVFWHAYFGAIVIVLIMRVRPPKRLCGVLLGFPLLSVSIIAWAYSNPFNGIVFALIIILLFYISGKLPRENVRTAPSSIMIPGIILFIFGWIYPHFLETPSFFPYLYSAPIGLIPCPTLSIVIGLALVLNGLESRALYLVLGFSGLFYGITGAVRLGVQIDNVLVVGAVLIFSLVFARKKPGRKDKPATG